MRFQKYNEFIWISRKIIFLLCLTYFPFSTFAGERIAETFPIDGIEQGIFLPVTINELQYTMLVDTGATFTILDSSFKPLLGKPFKKEQARTAVSSTDVEFFKPVDIYARGINLTTKHHFIASDLIFLNKVAGVKFQGILGMAVMYKRVWEINFDERIITITSKPFDEIESSGFTLLKITPNQNGVPTIPVKVGDKESKFIIDTGDNGFGRLQPEIIDSLISQALVEHVAIDTTVSISGIAEVRRIKLKEIEI